MTGFLRRALGKLDTRRSAIQADLGRLNDLVSGLGDSATEFVATGRGETVLSTLTVSPGAKELGICRRWLGHDETATRTRDELFFQVAPYDLPLLARYARVLAAVSDQSPPDAAAGSGEVPLAFRILLSEACQALQYGRNRSEANGNIHGWTPDRLQQIAELLGASKSDIIDVFYHDTGQWGHVNLAQLRPLVAIKSIVEDNPLHVIEAGSRIPARGRAAMIGDLGKWELAGKEPFLGFIVAQCGDGAKAVREAATALLRQMPEDTLLPTAIEKLSTGNVALRESMVTVLASMSSDEAAKALDAQLAVEKTARIKSAIQTARSASAVTAGADDPDDATGYVALDGSRVEIPPMTPIQDETFVAFGKAEIEEIATWIREENDRIDKDNAARRKENANSYQARKIPGSVAKEAVGLLSGQKQRPGSHVTHVLEFKLADWTRRQYARMPLNQRLQIAMAGQYSAQYAISGHAGGPSREVIGAYLTGEGGDLRALEELIAKAGIVYNFGGYRNRTSRPLKDGDFMRAMIPSDSYAVIPADTFHPQVIWPYVAANLDVIDEALGLRPVTQEELGRAAAVRYLSNLPKPPRRYFGALLEVATGTTKAGRAEARALLGDAEEVYPRLLALLDDSRQAVRAGAAEWIAERGDTDAIPAMKARLKKEKSELARAAILTAMRRLGAEIDAFVGPAALSKEAETGLKKAKFDKLAWLDLEHLPKAKYASGAAVPADVLRWWVFLAFKLKQPGGNGLFEIWLDQLDPQDAATFSQWLFEAWIAHDTARPSDEEGNAYAKQHVAARFQAWKRWYKDMTEEQCFAQLKREFTSNYLNSGAESKGLLGLATRVPSAVAADHVRAYLKNHGKRTSQASALLELIAAKGDPVSLQVMISAATRLKQKGVQAFAGELVQKVADRNDWTLDELGDRTIPTAGLDDDGVLDLPCGPDEKLYRATLSEDLTLVLTNPDGKQVKALSSTTDDNTKASKKQLSTSKKELKQVIALQSGRLYEGLCAGRTWTLEAWQRDFRDHPVMRRLTERVVWEGLDADGQPLGTFRPTAEGEFTDPEDNAVDPETFAILRLAHGATLPRDTATAWDQHFTDYEVKPLFTQFGRKLIDLPEDKHDSAEIDDRKGWLSDTFTIRGHATKLGWERGQPMDGGGFDDYRKPFRSAGIVAVVNFTGSYVPEENLPAALTTLSFETDGRRMGQKIKLKDVPPVLLSECWNDYHAMAAKAAFDPDWRKKGLY